MKFIPILFSTPMVQANLNRRKTMTRRLNGLKEINVNPDDWLVSDPIYCHPEGLVFEFLSRSSGRTIRVKSPYGRPGDVLWVRESFQYSDDLAEPYWYKQKHQDDYLPEYHKDFKWKPSIHMPKEACRLFLKVKNIRVERLQDISEEDAIAEGIKCIGENEIIGGELYKGKWYENYGKDGYVFLEPKESFQTLWQSINGLDSWEANPWVWVIEYERIEKPENFK